MKIISIDVKKTYCISLHILYPSKVYLLKDNVHFSQYL